jgi:hypothetical protein
MHGCSASDRDAVSARSVLALVPEAPMADSPAGRVMARPPSRAPGCLVPPQPATYGVGRIRVQTEGALRARGPASRQGRTPLPRARAAAAPRQPTLLVPREKAIPLSREAAVIRRRLPPSRAARTQRHEHGSSAQNVDRGMTKCAVVRRGRQQASSTARLPRCRRRGRRRSRLAVWCLGECPAPAGGQPLTMEREAGR